MLLRIELGVILSLSYIANPYYFLKQVLLSCFGWPWACIPPATVSQVERITGVGPCTQLGVLYFQHVHEFLYQCFPSLYWFQIEKTISLSKYIIVIGNPVQNTQWRHKAYLLPLEPVLWHENCFSSVLMLSRASTDRTGRGLGATSLPPLQCQLHVLGCCSWL